MITSRLQLKNWLEYESKKYERKNINFPLFCFSEKDLLWKHQCLLRYSEYYLNKKYLFRKLIFRFWLRKFQFRYSLNIPMNVFGKGLRIMHLGPILVNSNVLAGENISIHSCVGIVAGGSSNEVPNLKSNIVIGFGAVLLGGIIIEDGIAVGANSVVNKSFLTPNITIAGVPAKQISTNSSYDWEIRKNNESNVSI